MKTRVRRSRSMGKSETTKLVLCGK